MMNKIENLTIMAGFALIVIIGIIFVIELIKQNPAIM
jgi:hypothetical protein